MAAKKRTKSGAAKAAAPAPAKPAEPGVDHFGHGRAPGVVAEDEKEPAEPTELRP